MSEYVSTEVIQKTQIYLGKYIKKPPLNEKLLKKPPFRFLHDIIISVIKETGFLKGLFNEQELLSDNVKEKDAKIAFLTKLIDAVKVVTKTEIKVKASKIVAGLEPTETNIFLQTIAKALDKKLDSTEYMKKLKSGEITADKKIKKTTESTIKKPKTNVKDEKLKKSKGDLVKKNTIEMPKSTDRSNSKSRPKRDSKDKSETKNKSKHKSEPKTNKKERKGSIENIMVKEENDLLQMEKADENPDNIENTSNINSFFYQSAPDRSQIESVEQNVDPVFNTNITAEFAEKQSDLFEQAAKDQEKEPHNDLTTEEPKEERLKSARPKSARPKSVEKGIKNAVQELGEAKEDTTTVMHTQKAQLPQRPKSSLRPPSVRPSSARPGAPRLRPDSALPVHEVVTMGKINVIVESFDKDADDEETVVIQNAPDLLESSSDMIDVLIENKGHLVEQILEQINDGDENMGPKVDIDCDKDGIKIVFLKY